MHFSAYKTKCLCYLWGLSSADKTAFLQTMNGHGASLEWKWQENTELFGEDSEWRHHDALGNQLVYTPALVTKNFTYK